MKRAAKCFLVCPTCKHKFPSPITFGSVEAFETSTLIGNMTACPKCKQPFEINKENMIFLEMKDN